MGATAYLSHCAPFAAARYVSALFRLNSLLNRNLLSRGDDARDCSLRRISVVETNHSVRAKADVERMLSVADDMRDKDA